MSRRRFDVHSLSWEIRQGDALERLREMPDGSVQCVVTSPPYWGLRDYGEDGQLGLEETPEEYVANMVEVFREVRRVLRGNGTLWLNLGDSYAATGKSGGGDQGERWERNGHVTTGPRGEKWSPAPPGLKPKDLVGIPWRVAFALQADGWWLRSDIIWSKPNPMPESVRDRPTKAHEYVFLLSKAERYFYDADAIAEGTAFQVPPDRRSSGDYSNGSGRNDGGEHRSGGFVSGPTRNRRTVWEITTTPYPAAHFAVFPLELPEVCIKAGTSEKGCCPECGAPWERVVEVERKKDPNRHTGRAAQGNGDRMDGDWPRMLAESRTTGWQPTCDHDSDPIPCTVLDPFAGAGTTGLVALRLRRSFIGIDLSGEYCEMARERIRQDAPLFNVTVEIP